MAEYRVFFFDRADKVRVSHNIDLDNDGDAIDSPFSSTSSR
jgi:hypothetical protein